MRIQVHKSVVAIAVCLFAQMPFAGAGTYFVSSSQGNDTNSGTAANAPWKSLNNVYNHTYGAGIFKPGDQILLRAGDSFDGPLRLCQSGAEGSNIVVGRYGTGADPIIFGDHPSAKWSAVPGHAGVYSSVIGPSGLVSVQSVYDVNGNAYTKSVQETNTLDDWLNTFTRNTWGGNAVVYVCTSDGNPPPQMRVMELAAISCNSRKYLTFQNLEICNSYIGIQPVYGSHLLVQSNFVHDTLNIAVYFATCSYSTIAYNRVLRTGNTQLYMQNGGNNWVHHNTCSIAGSNSTGISILGIPVPPHDDCGVGLQQGTNNLVEYNAFSYIYVSCIDYYYEVNTEVRYNYGFHCGLGADTHGTGLLFHHNIFDLDGVGKGILCAQAYDPRYSRISNNLPQIIYNNVVYRGVVYGICTSLGGLSTGTSTNVVLRNNIIVTTAANQDMVWFNPGVDSDYNLYYCTAGTTRGWLWNGSSRYSSLAGMRTGTGQEGHSIYASPQFVSMSPATAADFQLKPRSPCIGAAQDLRRAGLLASTQDYVDFLATPIPRGPRADIGAYEKIPSLDAVGRLR